MNITTNCREIEYEVTTLIHIFFKKNQEGSLQVEAVEKEGSFSAVCELCYEEKTYHGSFSFAASVKAEAFEQKRFLCAAAAHAVYQAATQAIAPREISFPWGLMMGIRPVKMVHEYVKNGYSYEAALSRLQMLYGVSEQKKSLLNTVAKNEIALMDAMPDHSISLYIGIPFCPTRCLYCSFVSTDMRNSARYMENYVANLQKEIAYVGHLLKNSQQKIQCVYIGGGTPTSLSPIDLEKMLSSICQSFDLSHMTEFTVEAGRADTITEDKLRVMADFPVNRISVNPQTMHDETLQLIGRCHSVADVHRAYHLARTCTNFSINMDLIAGLPGENASMFYQSLEEVMSMEPDDITVHTMSIKRASRLKGEAEHMRLMQAKEAESMVAYASTRLQEQKYQPYYLYRQKNMIGNLENVGYAKSGHESFYNVNIMEEIQTILAMGCGGVSKIVDRESGKISRVFNFKDPMEYESRFHEMLDRKDEAVSLMEK